MRQKNDKLWFCCILLLFPTMLWFQMTQFQETQTKRGIIYKLQTTTFARTRTTGFFLQLSWIKLILYIYISRYASVLDNWYLILQASWKFILQISCVTISVLPLISIHSVGKKMFCWISCKCCRSRKIYTYNKMIEK